MILKIYDKLIITIIGLENNTKKQLKKKERNRPHNGNSSSTI